MSCILSARDAEIANADAKPNRKKFRELRNLSRSGEHPVHPALWIPLPPNQRSKCASARDMLISSFLRTQAHFSFPLVRFPVHSKDR